MRAAWLVLCVAVAAACVGDRDAPASEPATTRVIVGVRTTGQGRPSIVASQVALQARMLAYAAEPVHAFQTLPYVVMRVDDDALARLRADPAVTSVREDRIADPLLDSSTVVIRAPQAWAAGYTGAGQVVAVIDSGVRSDHVNLAGKVVAEACFSTTDPSFPSQSVCPGGVSQVVGAGAAAPCASGVTGCDHGTHVAAIAVGGNVAPSGVARNANLIAIQAGSRFDDATNCKGAPPCVRFFDSDWVRGLEHVLMLKQGGTPVAAVNMSLGSGEFATRAACDLDNPAGKAAIDNLRAAGVVTVISAGNDGHTAGLASPACISSAVSVGATSDADTVAAFSDSALFLDLLAPGVTITAADPVSTTGLVARSGTSMAAPHAAGAFAVLRQARPSLTVDQAIAVMKTSGTPVLDGRNGVTVPRIDAMAAIDAAGPEPPVASPPPGSYAPPLAVSLSTPTNGAEIRYTLDGSTVTATSTLYTGPIAIDPGSFVTVRARAFLPGLGSSAERVAAYEVFGMVAAPVLSPPPGAYPALQSVTITSATPGAIIRVTTDGTAVTASSPMYAGPIAIGAEATVMVRAKAFRAGWIDAAEIAGTYTITCVPAAPGVVLAPSTRTSGPGGTVTFDATITNNDGAGCLPAELAIARGVPAGWTATLATPTVTLAAGQSTQVQLEVTSAAAAVAGDFPVMVTASNARSGNGSGSATYTVTCTRAVPSLAIAPPAQSGQVGEALGYTVTLTNHDLGCAASTFALAATVDLGWTATYDVAMSTLASGATTTAILTVTPGAGTALGSHPVVAAVTRPESAGALASATYDVQPTCARGAPTLVISPPAQSAVRGTTLTYTAELTNNDSACGASLFALSFDVPAAWSASGAAITVPSGATVTGTFDVTSSPTAPAGDAVFTVHATSQVSGATSATATYHVSSQCVRRTPMLSVTQPPALTSPAPARYAVRVTNADHEDCGPTTFTLTAVVPSGWTSPAGTATVAPGAGADVELTVTPPVGLGVSSTTFDITATSPAGHAAVAQGTYALGCGRRAPSLALSTVQEHEHYRVVLVDLDTALCSPTVFHVRVESELAVTPADADVAIGPGMQGELDLRIARGARSGDHEVRVLVTRPGDPAPVAEDVLVVTIEGDDGGCATSAPSAGALVLVGVALALRRRRALR